MTDTATTRSPLWIRIALLVSLAVNLAIVAFVAGFMLRGPGPATGFNPLAIDGFRAIFRALPPDDQREMRASLDERRRELRSARREIREIREEFLTVLAADTYSAAALEEVFRRQAQVHQALSTGAQRALLDQIDRMSNEERQAFAIRLREELSKRRRPRRAGP